MRCKCYIVRHQATGFLTQRIFLKPPADSEVKAVLEEFAGKHPAECWHKVVETVLIVPDSQPKAGWFEAAPVEEKSTADASTLSLPQIKPQGRGSVRPR